MLSKRDKESVLVVLIVSGQTGYTSKWIWSLSFMAQPLSAFAASQPPTGIAPWEPYHVDLLWPRSAVAVNANGDQMRFPTASGPPTPIQGESANQRRKGEEMQPRHKKPLRAFKCRRPLLCWNATPDTATPAMSQFVLDDHLDVHEVRRPN